jgi:hypothetical protein
MKLILWIIFLFQTFNIYLQEDRLVFLYTHFRHGARAPLDINDSFIDKLGEKWTNPGELTGVGQRMHYLLGRRNRIRYIKNEGFLSPKFNSHEILIYSSNINRTMVSVSSQLQGFYPQNNETGETLKDEQLEISYPQVDVNYAEINESISALGSSALPYQMTLAPVRMVNDNDRRMNVYDLEECIEERDDIKKKNAQTIPELIEYMKGFNKKYNTSFNKYFQDSNGEYDVFETNDICDAFLSNYWDKRKMSDFEEKTGLNFAELNDDCFTFFRMYYLYCFHGDEEKVLAHVDSSGIMEELNYFMKRRIDADITIVNEDANFKDYSRPKMVMRSGHDSTVSADLIFLIKALGLNESDIYGYPKYASQLAIEVRAYKTITSSSTYSDYNVIGYFDDKQIFNVTADKFISGLETEIWSDEKVNKFCGFDETDTDSNTNEKKSDKAKTAYKVLMSVFICLTAILLASTIFLAYKLSKLNKPKAPMEPNFDPNKTINSSMKNN